MKNMRCLSLLLLSSMLLNTACATTTYPQKKSYAQPEALIVKETQKNSLQLTANLLSKYHYRAQTQHEQLLDEISASVIDDYLHALDYSRIIFLQSDIEEFAHFRQSLRQNTRTGDLSAAITIFERYRERNIALNHWTLERLKQPFDLNTTQTITYPRDVYENRRAPWRKTLEEVHDFQEKRLTDELIRLVMSGRSEEKAVEMLVKRYQSVEKRLNQMTSDDVFDMYMNTIANNFDPHTNYLSPDNSEDFDINMSLALEGIGATLSYKDDKITIRELLPGGPAYKSGKLKINDQIIAVAQGKDGEMEDIVGMRLDKAVRLIRGKKGTLVRLLIEPANAAANLHEVTIERDRVKLEDQAAQAFVETLSENGTETKIGVIRLPSFYMDFQGAREGEKEYRSTSRDVERLLKELKAENVSAIIIDLRNDGGGSLYEAIRTVGLFIDQGPVVMVSDINGNVNVEKDKDAGAIYDGPLAVMINSASASASEIFAAAIQDYKRGLIIGTNSFGKGTVQTIIDLNRFVPDTAPKLGEVKFTIAMFHRINGSSTQKKGVQPDIAFPTIRALEEMGESKNPHSLDWKAIPPADYVLYNNITDREIATLQQNHESRMLSLPVLNRFTDYIKRLGAENERNVWSLNVDVRRQQYDAWKKYTETYEYDQQDAIPPLNADAKRKKDVAERNAVADEEDKERFIPDIELYEALHVLKDFTQLRHSSH